MITFEWIIFIGVTHMGLFKSKKNAIEQAKKDSIHEIVCLYCFRNFSHDRVMFRALEALDTDGYQAQTDLVLDDYRSRFHLDSAGELNAVLDPDEFSEIHKGYHRGVLSSLKDDYDNITTKRLCPYCHNDITQSAGFSPSTIISVVGAKQSGKSVYLTSLIHTLKSVTPHNFPIFCTPINSEMGRKFKSAYEDPLIEKGRLIYSAHGKQQEPFIFTLSFSDGSKPEINVAFFDGTSDEYMDIYAAHIRNSSGILFLVDPMQFRSVGRKIQLKNHLDFLPSDEPVDILSELVDDYIYKQGGEISDIPTAIILSKTDLLESLAGEEDFVRTGSHFFSNYRHKEFFTISEFDKINKEIDKLITTVDPNFRNALTRRFSKLGFFAISALGHKIGTFAPIRVDEPFLWILYQMGYIEGYDSDGVRPTY